MLRVLFVFLKTTIITIISFIFLFPILKKYGANSFEKEYQEKMKKQNMKN